MSDTVAKPISEAVRRLEIFTGTGRRRTWSAVYVKEDGVWKIKMLTAILKPPPAK